MQRSLDEPILPSEILPDHYPFHGSMIVRPDGPEYLSFNQALGIAHSIYGKEIAINMSILCDSCQCKFPSALAERYTCRRKCSKCSVYYDICNECIAVVETCPWCHEVDLKW